MLWLELALVELHLLGHGLHNASCSGLHFRWGHSHLRWLSSTLARLWVALEWVLRHVWEKGGAARERERERWRGHVQLGPALPIFSGLCHHTGNAGEACWEAPVLRPLRVDGAGRAPESWLPTKQHTPTCCHPVSQQHRATGDTRPPAPSVAVTWLSHWTILCHVDESPCGLKKPSASFCASVSFPDRNLIPQGRIRKLNISLQELETPWGKQIPCSFAWFLPGWKIWEQRRNKRLRRTLTKKGATSPNAVVRTLSCLWRPGTESMGCAHSGSKVPSVACVAAFVHQ